MKGLPLTLLIFNGIHRHIHIDLVAHCVNLITPVVFQLPLPNKLVIADKYNIPLVQCNCQGFLVIPPFLPQCLHLSHVLSYSEGFSKCGNQLSYIAIYWPKGANDFMCRENKVYWQPLPSPEHKEVR